MQETYFTNRNVTLGDETILLAAKESLLSPMSLSLLY